jgi:Ca2+-binding RTX toxin-like protein
VESIQLILGQLLPIRRSGGGGFVIAADPSDGLLDRHVERAVGGAGNDVLIGNKFENLILAGLGNDLIVAGAGIDTVRGNGGNDEISVGDTVSYTGSSAIQVNLELSGPQSGGDAEGDVLVGIENVIGSAYADEFEGSSVVNRLEGRSGQDTFFIPTIAGANGDVLDGGFDNDTLDLSLATFTSLLTDPNGVDKFRFIVDLNAGSVKAAGMSTGLTSIENIVGSDLADKLIGNAGDNVINGGGGSDWIFGGAGADIIDGGDGRNKINYIDSNAAVDIDLNRLEQIGGHAQGDQLTNILAVDGSNYADTIKLKSEGWGFVWAAGGNDKIYGGTGQHNIYGDAGNDTFYYGGGKSTFYGGIGTNTLDLSLVDKGYLFDLGSAQKVVLENVSQQNADETISFFETQRFIGSEGNDIFKMYNKGYFVDGGLGIDTMNASSLDYSTGTGMIFNMVDGTVRSLGGVAFATFANIEKFIGTTGGDNFISYGPNGHFTGLAGGDTLWAGYYADWFDGGTDSELDVANCSNSNASVTVDLRQSAQYGGYAEGDQLNNVEAVVGSRFEDTLTIGGAGKSVDGGLGGDDIFVFAANAKINGGGGDDNINISGQLNTIYGGADADSFYFEGAFGGNKIMDYQHGEDIFFNSVGWGNPLSVNVNYNGQDYSISAGQNVLWLMNVSAGGFSSSDIFFV